MSVSSKLIMTTGKNKDELAILAEAEKSINNLLRQERKEKYGDSTFPWTKDLETSFSTHIEVNPSSRSFRLFFQYKGERRQLWLFTNYDHDSHDIVKTHNVQFSFGSWGTHEEILKHLQKDLANAFSKSKFYFHFNDCGDTYHAVMPHGLERRELNK